MKLEGRLFVGQEKLVEVGKEIRECDGGECNKTILHACLKMPWLNCSFCLISIANKKWEKNQMRNKRDCIIYPLIEGAFRGITYSIQFSL
jgi:hypothetical protein